MHYTFKRKNIKTLRSKITVINNIHLKNIIKFRIKNMLQYSYLILKTIASNKRCNL